MSDERDDQERPCLHCMIVELIDDFFDEYPAATGESDTIDPDEVVQQLQRLWQDSLAARTVQSASN
jgi:hypothetical protein